VSITSTKESIYNAKQASKNRINTAKEACNRYNITYNGDAASRFVISDKYKFMIDIIPKVGSGTMRGIGIKLNPESTITFYRIKMRDMSEFGHYTKIVFFRDPLERLVSFYYYAVHSTRNTGSGFYEAFLSVLAKQAGSDLKDWLNHNITFREMAEVIINVGFGDEYVGKAFPQHVNPQYMVSNICSFNADFIGHLDKLYEDIQYIFKVVGVTDENIYPAPHVQKGHDRLKDTIKDLP
ncbi:carbohydrate sulfotransferase 9-like, partial [Saccoglossus kowalevskii]|uniref:Carbohydrate sulfotransferase n=1 Tax=Saccoglossus kowalevskii TaxID=10224 RepID=A0ABM0MUK8_SACKO